MKKIILLLSILLLFISVCNVVIASNLKEKGLSQQKVDMFYGYEPNSICDTIEWSKSEKVVGGIDDHILDILYKCDFVKSDIPVEQWLYKITYGKISHTGKGLLEIEIGEKSISICGELYTCKTEKEYKTMLKSIEIQLHYLGFDYDFILE